MKDLSAPLHPEGRFRGLGESKPPGAFGSFAAAKEQQKHLFLKNKGDANYEEHISKKIG